MWCGGDARLALPGPTTQTLATRCRFQTGRDRRRKLARVYRCTLRGSGSGTCEQEETPDALPGGLEFRKVRSWLTRVARISPSAMTTFQTRQS
jgi:hypothetical protein